MLVNDAYLQRLINIQKQNVRNSFLSAGVLATVGVGVMSCSFFLGYLLPPELYKTLTELNKTLLTIAGMFIGSVSAIPFANITRRQEKMATLELLKSKLCEAIEASDAASLDEISKVMDIVLKPTLDS
jgi:hypothetical protein